MNNGSDKELLGYRRSNGHKESLSLSIDTAWAGSTLSGSRSKADIARSVV